MSRFNREKGSDQIQTVTSTTVLKNGRDLAVNLSLHGYGLAHFAAIELQETIKYIIKMFEFPEVLQAYGVTGKWQLQERISQLYLKGSGNGVKKRTLATTGLNIIQWLANNKYLLVDPTGEFSLDDPNAKKMANNVERWLAVNGTDNESIQRYSDAISVDAQPTIPSLSMPDLSDPVGNLLSPGNGIDDMANLANLGNIAKA